MNSTPSNFHHKKIVNSFPKIETLGQLKVSGLGLVTFVAWEIALQLTLECGYLGSKWQKVTSKTPHKNQETWVMGIGLS